MKIKITDLKGNVVFQGQPKTAEEIGEMNKRWPADNKKFKRTFI